MREGGDIVWCGMGKIRVRSGRGTCGRLGVGGRVLMCGRMGITDSFLWVQIIITNTFVSNGLCTNQSKGAAEENIWIRIVIGYPPTTASGEILS